MSDAQTLATYARHAADYKARFAQDPAPSRHLLAFMAELADGARVLDLGCGTGSARDTLSRHYTYYREDELVQVLQASDLQVVARDFGEQEGLDGTVFQWIVLRAHG